MFLCCEIQYRVQLSFSLALCFCVYARISVNVYLCVCLYKSTDMCMCVRLCCAVAYLGLSSVGFQLCN